jgi:hypothetical protein
MKLQALLQLSASDELMVFDHLKDVEMRSHRSMS